MSERWRVEHGDCLTVMRSLPDQSVDAIVTDPPYELGFMGKSWDASGVAYRVDVWAECLRLLKPGGHLLAFGGSRTYHRMACAIEDAGFEIRDQIMWVYGSGFPKSLDVSKAIDKMHGITERPVISEKRGAERLRAQTDDGRRSGDGRWGDESHRDPFVRAAVSDDARRWQGWGTALKPAHEPIVVARRPLDGTVAQNVIWYGTGALNIDGCRVGTEGGTKATGIDLTIRVGDPSQGFRRNTEITTLDAGRFPANLIHDGSNEVLELFPESKSPAFITRGAGGQHGKYSPIGRQEDVPCYDDSGSAARFFYCAKASRAEREAGLQHLPADAPVFGDDGGTYKGLSNSKSLRSNHHPTVKPIALMRYLIRLVTQPGGIVLDPFTGSGTTGIAAIREQARFIGIEQSADYIEIARTRIAYHETHDE